MGLQRMGAAIKEMNPTPLLKIHTDGKKYAVLIIIVYERWVERKLNNILCWVKHG